MGLQPATSRLGREKRTLDTDVNVVLRLLGLAWIVIGLREGVEGFEVLNVRGHEPGWRDWREVKWRQTSRRGRVVLVDRGRWWDDADVEREREATREGGGKTMVGLGPSHFLASLSPAVWRYQNASGRIQLIGTTALHSHGAVDRSYGNHPAYPCRLSVASPLCQSASLLSVSIA
jgi:hypothetical protein